MTFKTEKKPLLGNAKRTPTVERTPSVHSADSNRKDGGGDGKSMFPVLCVLLTELFERLTFYSISANLALFCTSKLKLSSPDATSVLFIFTGACYFVPVVSGWIADSVSGQYNAIYGSALLYLAGTFLLFCSAVDYRHLFGLHHGQHFGINLVSRTVLSMCGLLLVAVGSGGIKANICPFGARQAERVAPQAVPTFFQWFYFIINVGCFLAYSVVAYVQQNVGFTLGYAIPLFTMALCLTCFVAGKSDYQHSSRAGNLLRGTTEKHMDDPVSMSEAVRCPDEGSTPPCTLGALRTLGLIMPVFGTLIMYWAIDSQLSSTFLLQSVRLDVKVGSLVAPAAALNLVDVTAVLLLIPLLDRVLYPGLSSRGVHPTPLQRMGFGMVLSALSVVCAGILEIYRKQNLSETGGFIQVIGDEAYNSSTLSMFLQVPQFALIGASEVFTATAGLEFAYSQSPGGMQGVIMGLYFFTDGLGNFLDIALIQIVRLATAAEPWFPHEINHGHMEYLYFLLAGLMAVNLGIFVAIAKCYKYPTGNSDRLAVSDTDSSVAGSDVNDSDISNSDGRNMAKDTR